MYISPSNRILPQQSTIMYTDTKINASFRRTEDTFSGNNSDRNDMVILSLTDTSINIESMHSAENITESSQTASYGQESNPVENPLYQYLELIRERVEYLLKELSQQISENSPNNKSLEPTGNQDFRVHGSITYSRSTILVSQNMTTASLNSYFPDFSPESTAQRIIQFALSFYNGGDRQEYAAMARKAVMKGYNEAREALGVLPQISFDTIALVNRALDVFAGGKEITLSS